MNYKKFSGKLFFFYSDYTTLLQLDAYDVRSRMMRMMIKLDDFDLVDDTRRD